MTGKFRVAMIVRPAHQSFIDGIKADPLLELVHLSTAQDESEIRAGLSTCHGYYVSPARDDLPEPWRVTPRLLASMPRLLIAVSYAAGYDTIDVKSCSAAGVLVCAQMGGNAQGVAEHALGMMLSLLKRIGEAHGALREGTVSHRDQLMGRELAGRTVGIVGLGNIGSRLAKLLKVFDCEVLAYDPYLDAETCTTRGARKVAFNDLLAASEIVSVHCPLTAETKGMFGADAFARMRQGALFIATARGTIHDEAALRAALESGHLAGAGLDVWDQEPPAADNWLVTHRNVIATPHTAGVTFESRERVGRMAAEVFSAAARGKTPPRVVNGDVADVFAQRFEGMFGRVSA